MFEQTLYGFDGLNDKNKAQLHYLKDGVLTEKVSGNFVLINDKTAMLRDEQAFIRLWWDTEFTKSKGKYLVEVIFRSDLSEIQSGTYSPRFIPKANEPKHRDLWEEVPERARAGKPIELYSGDCVTIDGQLFRYNSFNIANGEFKFKNIKNDAFATGYPTISKWDPDKCPITVIQEDILGECFKSLKKEG